MDLARQPVTQSGPKSSDRETSALSFAPGVVRGGAGTSQALQPRRAASIAAMSIFFIPIIASKARFASSPPAASASVSTRGVICQEIPPLVFAPPALALLSAITDDCVPVAVRL